MDMRPYRAFGLVFIVNTRQTGERYKVVIQNPDCTIFCVDGLETCVNSDTGEVMPDYEAGWIHSPEKNYVQGRFDLAVIRPTTVYCYDPKLNGGMQQQFGVIDIPQGESVVLPKATRLVLCHGSIEVDGRVIAAPTKIRVESENRQIIARTRVLGLTLE